MPSRRTRTRTAVAVSTACAGVGLGAATMAHGYERCCFRVQVESAGFINTDWGADPSKPHNGFHKLRWSWQTRQLMSYSENDGFRQLGDACAKARGARICARNKVSAWMREESNLIEQPSDPVSRREHGQCTNEVTAGKNAQAWIDARGSFNVAISSPQQNNTGRSLILANAGPNVIGKAKFADKCWFGIGDHSSSGHEPGADLAAARTGSIWELVVPTPAPARFRGSRRIIANGPAGVGFDHDAAYENNWGPHTSESNEVTQVRLTPFPRRRLADEIEALNRLR